MDDKYRDGRHAESSARRRLRSHALDWRMWAGLSMLWSVLAISVTLWNRHDLESLGDVNAPVLGTVFSLPGGRDPNGVVIPAPVAGRSACYLVRYTSTKCSYCQMDEQIFEAFAADPRASSPWRKS